MSEIKEEMQKAEWYVVHTYSGHENKVKATIEQAVKAQKMEEYILKVVIPTENVDDTAEEENETTEKTKKKKTSKKRTRKIYPSYVFINMIMNSKTWYLVRNTKGVTGFLGPDSKQAVPLTEADIASMGLSLEILSDIDIQVGDSIKVISGGFKGKSGIVKEIDAKNGEVKISLDDCDNSMTFEISIESIEKI